ncbi:MAG: hypothetical protein ACXVBB_14050, partial [Isosphaeraceae bacterium]
DPRMHVGTSVYTPKIRDGQRSAAMSAVPARSSQSVVGIAAVVIASMTAAQPLLQERIASHGHDEGTTAISIQNLKSIRL